MSSNKVLPILFATLLLDSIGFGIVFPIIPIIFTDPSSPSFILQGYTQSSQFFIAGALTGLFGLTQFIASPILGELSDVYGRKKLLTLGVGVLALSQAIFGFGIGIASIPLLFIARAVAGLAAANFSIAQATIADVTDPTNRAKNFGLIGASFGLGFIIGPLVSGWLASLSNNPALPFWTASALGVINLVFISLFLPETRQETQNQHSFTVFKGIYNIIQAWQDNQARKIYSVNFFYMCGFAFFTSFIGVLLVTVYHLSASEIGTFFALVGVCIVISQMFVLRILTRRFSELQILRYSIPIVATLIAIYPFVPDSRFVYLLVPFLSIPQGVSMANLPALLSKSVSAQKQGAALGINGSLMALAQGIIPLAAGVGSGLIGVKLPFVAGGALVVLAWVILFSPKKQSN